jgi:hypothetical protein
MYASRRDLFLALLWLCDVSGDAIPLYPMILKKEKDCVVLLCVCCWDCDDGSSILILSYTHDRGVLIIVTFFPSHSLPTTPPRKQEHHETFSFRH